MASGGAASSAVDGSVASTSQGGGSCTLSRKSFAGSTGSSLGRGDRRQRTHMIDTSDEELDNSQVRGFYFHFRLKLSNWIWKFNWKTNKV